MPEIVIAIVAEKYAVSEKVSGDITPQKLAAAAKTALELHAELLKCSAAEVSSGL